jgi:hypothetical protein
MKWNEPTTKYPVVVVNLLRYQEVVVSEFHSLDILFIHRPIESKHGPNKIMIILSKIKFLSSVPIIFLENRYFSNSIHGVSKHQAMSNVSNHTTN